MRTYLTCLSPRERTLYHCIINNVNLSKNDIISVNVRQTHVIESDHSGVSTELVNLRQFHCHNRLLMHICATFLFIKTLGK